MKRSPISTISIRWSNIRGSGHPIRQFRCKASEKAPKRKHPKMGVQSYQDEMRRGQPYICQDEGMKLSTFLVYGCGVSDEDIIDVMTRFYTVRSLDTLLMLDEDSLDQLLAPLSPGVRKDVKAGWRQKRG